MPLSSPPPPAPTVTVTDRERARLTALLDALPSAAALFASGGTLLAINPRGRELFVVDALAPLESQHWKVVLQPLGDAAASAVYGKSYSKDADFYSFYRSMQSYRQSIGKEGDVLVISPDSAYFKYMGKGEAAR